MTRAGLTEKLLDIKREKGWTWKYICAEIGGMSEVLIVGACLGQMKLTKPQCEKAGSCLASRNPKSVCSTRFQCAACRCRPPIP